MNYNSDEMNVKIKNQQIREDLENIIADIQNLSRWYARTDINEYIERVDDDCTELGHYEQYFGFFISSCEALIDTFKEMRPMSQALGERYVYEDKKKITFLQTIPTDYVISSFSGPEVYRELDGDMLVFFCEKLIDVIDNVPSMKIQRGD